MIQYCGGVAYRYAVHDCCVRATVSINRNMHCCYNRLVQDVCARIAIIYSCVVNNHLRLCVLRVQQIFIQLVFLCL
jgi:hypothetical protein